MTPLNSMQEKVFLIFGGGGFIGANLAGKLVQAGARVISVSRTEATKPAQAGIRHVVGNIDDVESYRHLLTEADHIVYLISATTPGSSAQDAMLDVRANLTPFIAFLEANAAANKLPITFASSGGTVYGVPHYLPIDERHATDPICPYGIVKLAMEKYLALYSRNHGSAYIILRLANPYGGRFHRRVDQGVIDVFARKISGDQPLTVWGEGAVVRDYVHIDDVCTAFLSAFDYRGTSRVFNIGSGKGHSVREIIAALAHHTNKTPEIIFQPGRRHDIRENVLDISLARTELDWAPTIKFEDGVVDTIRNVS